MKESKVATETAPPVAKATNAQVESVISSVGEAPTPALEDDSKLNIEMKIEKLRGELLSMGNEKVKDVLKDNLNDWMKEYEVLTDEELKIKLRAFSQELHDYTHLEATRLYETLLTQEKYLHEKTLSLLAHQSKKYK